MYTWINHHIEAGHGPPNFFITLSCAEYLWPDIKRLIEERLKIAGLDTPKLGTSNPPHSNLSLINRLISGHKYSAQDKVLKKLGGPCPASI